MAGRELKPSGGSSASGGTGGAASGIVAGAPRVSFVGIVNSSPWHTVGSPLVEAAELAHARRAEHVAPATAAGIDARLAEEALGDPATAVVVEHVQVRDEARRPARNPAADDLDA